LSLKIATYVLHYYRLEELISQSLLRAAEGFFGYNSPKPEPIWMKLGISMRDSSGIPWICLYASFDVGCMVLALIPRKELIFCI